jgi:hypothetical protein
MLTSVLKWLPEIWAFRAKNMEVIERLMDQYLTFWIFLIFLPSGPRADAVGILEKRVVPCHCKGSFHNSQDVHPIACLLTNYT